MQPKASACASSCVGTVSFKRSLLATVSSLGLLALPAAVQAGELPTGGSVVSGNAAIGALPGKTPGLLINQFSDRAIVDWSSFSIGGGHQVHFDNASGATLNRVTGASGSRIDGLLSGTGSVFLVNPNGVIIGRDGVVDVGGSFVGSTLDVSNSDFMAGGDLTFAGDSTATVVNYGRIGALGGDVALIGARVENHGAINAAGGTAALVAGHEVLMRDAALADGKFLVKVGGSDTAAVNTGSIRAAEVELRANQGNVLALAGNTDGVIRATGVRNSGGRVFLSAPGGSVQVQGRVKAARHTDEAEARQGGNVFLNADAVSVEGLIDVSGLGDVGGTAIIEGRDISLAADARIDASGSDGGLVLIGGDYQGGADPAENSWSAPVLNAETVTVADGAAIKADGTGGDGGKVVVWSEKRTEFAGLITARGGQETGDGGFVEISSRGTLSYDGTVDTSADNGARGTLLLDPGNIRIIPGIQFCPGACPEDETFISAVFNLQPALADNNVILATSSEGALAGDISIESDITWDSDSSLTLMAHRNITISDGRIITNTGAGDLTLRADSIGTGVGLVEFIGSGKVDFSQSTGEVSVFYNPPTSYVFPLDYEPFVLTNPAASDQFTAHMLVNDVFDLQNIQQNFSGTYALGKDIDASDTVNWNDGAGFIPLGNLTTPFTGDVFGDGRAIDQLTIHSLADSVGLFGAISATASIESVGLSNVDIIGAAPASSVGALVGSNLGGTVRNSYVTGGTVKGGPALVLDGGGSRSGNVGGLIGRNFGSTALLTGSFSKLAVVGVAGSGGGLAGHNSGMIVGSYSEGSVDVISNRSASAGGLVGTNTGEILQSYSLSSVSATLSFPLSGARAGGLVAWNIGAIKQSYAAGDVFLNGTTSSAGGFVGRNEGTIADSYATGLVSTGDLSFQRAGGFAGDNAGSGSITRSYATGFISAAGASPLLGGFVGLNADSFAGGVVLEPGGPITESYWDVETTGQAIAAGGGDTDAMGLATAQLKSGLPAGFDPEVWGIDPVVNDGYPHLLWQVGEATPPDDPTPDDPTPDDPTPDDPTPDEPTPDEPTPPDEDPDQETPPDEELPAFSMFGTQHTAEFTGVLGMRVAGTSPVLSTNVPSISAIEVLESIGVNYIAEPALVDALSMIINQIPVEAVTADLASEIATLVKREFLNRNIDISDAWGVPTDLVLSIFVGAIVDLVAEKLSDRPVLVEMARYYLNVAGASAIAYYKIQVVIPSNVDPVTHAALAKLAVAVGATQATISRVAEIVRTFIFWRSDRRELQRQITELHLEYDRTHALAQEARAAGETDMYHLLTRGAQSLQEAIAILEEGRAGIALDGTFLNAIWRSVWER